MSFETAYAAMLRHEGWYSDDPNDPGGPTWRGIARNRQPAWPGWTRFDEIVARFPSVREAIPELRRDPVLAGMVEDLYHSTFWRPLRLDEIADPTISAKVFDMTVNMGWAPAVLCLQNACNYLIRRAEEIAEDGKIGPRTIAAVNAQNPRRLLLALRGYHFMHYERLVEGPNARFETFAPGWLERALGEGA